MESRYEIKTSLFEGGVIYDENTSGCRSHIAIFGLDIRNKIYDTVRIKFSGREQKSIVHYLGYCSTGGRQKMAGV